MVATPLSLPRMECVRCQVQYTETSLILCPACREPLELYYGEREKGTIRLIEQVGFGGRKKKKNDEPKEVLPVVFVQWPKALQGGGELHGNT